MTLVELLGDIKLRSLRGGHTEKVLCPKCLGGTHSEKSLAVTIDDDARGFAALCHRGGCGWRDGKRVEERAKPSHAAPSAKSYVAPPAKTPEQAEDRPQWLYEFFAHRCIGARVVHAFGVHADRRWFPEIGDMDAIAFPYVWQGKVTNRKYRPRGLKHPQTQEKSALPTLYNIDSVTDTMHICEGEPDCMALAECGIKTGVSLKDGASAQMTESDKRFAALSTHEEILKQVKRVFLCGDMDAPGLVLREELARRLGRHRSWLVTWPEGCKDANETLIRHGPDSVLQAVAEADPYPIEGVHRIRPGTLSRLRQTPAPGTLTTGTRASDAILSFPAEGRLIVVLGYPSHGKSSWLRFVMIHTAKDYNRRWCVFSPEMQPWEQFAAQCAEVYVGRPFWPLKEAPGVRAMNDQEVAEAETWLADKVSMLVCDAEDQAPTLDWLLERFVAAILRDGVTDCAIDPWNEVDQSRLNLSETDFIGRSLQRLKGLCHRHGVNVWVAAHPAKPLALKPGETRPPPGPYDTHGSSHWANKPDLVLTVHSPQPPHTELHLGKSRFARWGQRNSKALMLYDKTSGRYNTPVDALQTLDRKTRATND